MPTLQFRGDVHFHARVCGSFQEGLLSGWLVGQALTSGRLKASLFDMYSSLYYCETSSNEALLLLDQIMNHKDDRSKDRRGTKMTHPERYYLLLVTGRVLDDDCPSA